MDVNELKVFPELSELTGNDRQDLLEFAEFQQLGEGRRIRSMGTEAEGLVLVASGRIRLEVGPSRPTQILEAPIALGGHSLISVGPALATVIADTPCSVWRLDRPAYRRLVDDRPRVACRLLEGILAQSAFIGRRLIGTSESDYTA